MQNNLKELLAMRNMTVSEFARQTGIPQPTLHRIVNKRVQLESVTAINYLRIAHGLGLSAEQLYYGDFSYDHDKSTIDRIYAQTCNEGREAMLANAYGVQHTYMPYDSTMLPTIRDDMNALKGL